MLQELYIDFLAANKQLEKEAKHEWIGVVAGVIGLFVTFLWVVKPAVITASVGNLGLTVSFLAMIFGAWAYFAPPSRNKMRAGNVIIRNVNEKLDKYGYDPTIEFGEVRLKGQQTYLQIFEDSSYEDAEVKAEINRLKNREEEKK